MITHNLLKLADFLEKKVSQEEFDMARFRTSGESGNTGPSMPFVDIHNCGTVGCAVGWAPHCPGLRVKKADFDRPSILNSDRRPELNFWRYSIRLFGIDDTDPEWKWMFSGDWAHTDNTPTGCAARIRWLVRYGLPVNWQRQMDGVCSLDYAESSHAA